MDLRPALRFGFPLAALAFAACGNDRWLLDSGTIDSGSDVVRDTVRDSSLDLGCGDCVDDAIDAIDAADAPSEMNVLDVADAGSDAPDIVMDVPRDPPHDVVDVIDVPEDVGPSGRCTPTIDGALGADWNSDAIVASNTTPTTWGVGMNELHSIRVCYDTTALYLGVDGIAESGNAIVAYIDRDYDPPGGAPTGVSLFTALADNTGALDDAISADLSLAAGAGNFGAEAAWGSLGMASVAMGSVDANAGLRLIGPVGGSGPDRRADFAWISGSQTTCSASAQTCEVSIAWASLFEAPRPASGRVALFVRINNGLGTQSSNQTLPEDMPSMPRTVSRVLVIPYGP
jgi:hypothetical protein